jgi:hypothetical protein
MKIALLIFGITIFLIFNIYHEGKYMKLLRSWKKYYQMAFIGFLGLSLYLFMKKHPSDSQNMMKHAAQIVKYIPIDKDSSDLISPIFDFTNGTMFPQVPQQGGGNFQGNVTPQQKRMLNSGGKSTKRSVSETKKKFVAAQQSWTCGSCKEQLPAWFEVDHKIRLDSGGTNHIDNLVALCRDCHGRKTAMECL